MWTFVHIFIAVIGIHQTIFWTYFWQLKEYRWDRFEDGLKEAPNVFFKQYDLRNWYRPKFTARAVLTVFLGLWCQWVLGWWWLLLSIVGMCLSIVILSPLFNWQKRRIIDRATKKINKLNCVVVGITGSFGKSTTKEILSYVLSKKFKVVSTPNNINTEIGVAQSVLSWEDGFDYAVVEMGAYKKGEIEAICRMVKPKYGVITGLGDQHLSLFGSLDNIKRAKYELIESLPSDGKGWVIDKDFSLNDAKHIKEYQDRVEFEFEGVDFSVPVLGKQLITNVVAVVKVAMALGMTRIEVSKILRDLDTNKFWPKKIEVNENLVVIDNSYNASLNSFLSLLDYLKVWQGYRKILVTPGLIELGENGRKDHLIIGENLNNIDKVLLLNSKYFQELNVWKNVELVRLSELKVRIESNIKGKTVVIFKSRIPWVFIKNITDAKSN